MYNDFAEVYDRLQDADYEKFVDFYEAIFKKLGLKPELVLDMACGTGNITLPMSKRGYDMIGLDMSVEMLNIARWFYPFLVERRIQLSSWIFIDWH